MSISESIRQAMENSSWIRKMFEAGTELKKKYGQENVYDFSLGNPDLDPPAEFGDVLRRITANPGKGDHGYMANAGYPHVREKLARRVSRIQGVDIGGNYIIMTCGAAGGLNVVFKTILNNGEEVIVPKPYFVEYRFYIGNHNGKIVLVETNKDFSLNLQNIEKAITEKTKALLLNSPNNPTGKIYSQEEISAVKNLLKEHYMKTGRVIYLISDEPYREIVYDGKAVPGIFKDYEHSLVVSSYSKTLSIPGERIGYIAVNPLCFEADSLMSGLTLSNRILGFVNAPALMQRAVAELDNVSVDTNIYKKRRDAFVRGLGDAGYDFAEPEGAFYIFCKSPIQDDVKFVKYLQDYNILVVPGSGFEGPGYFRIAYCVSEEIILRAIPFFKEALKKIT